MNGSRSTSCIRHPQAPGQGLHSGPRESTWPDHFIAVLVVSQAHLTSLSELYFLLRKRKLYPLQASAPEEILFRNGGSALSTCLSALGMALWGLAHLWGLCTGMQLCDSAWGCSCKMFWFQFPGCKDDLTWPTRWPWSLWCFFLTEGWMSPHITSPTV